MERQEVYERIDQERAYQEKRWEAGLRERPDSEKDVAEWIIYMEFLLNNAKTHVYYLKQEAALEELRKVVAVGVACLEVHGCPKRNVIGFK